MSTEKEKNERKEMTPDQLIEYWWKRQCSKCVYRSTLHNGAHTGGTCGYILITGQMRGCDMEHCKRFQEGNKKVVRVGLGDLRTVIEVAKEKKRRRGHIKGESKCACGEWLDEHLGNEDIKVFTKAIGMSYSYFGKFRRRPGAVMSDRMAELTAKHFGVEVGEIRAAEERYARLQEENESRKASERAV